VARRLTSGGAIVVPDGQIFQLGGLLVQAFSIVLDGEEGVVGERGKGDGHVSGSNGTVKQKGTSRTKMTKAQRERKEKWACTRPAIRLEYAEV
jgi:hypothetical protein